MTENLFSYGTLRQNAVQLKTFGRLLDGTADQLPGYKIAFIKIEDEAVVVTSGMTHHPIISCTGNLDDAIEGTVFKITATELNHADDYEVDSYKRISVELKSGTSAWVYVDASE